MNKLISLQRYSISPEEFNLIQITHIIENDSCHIVSLFKEHLIYDEGTDFLRRFYGKRESSIRLTKLYEYYNASSMLFPNYTALPEGKYIYKNIMKKQKVIDLIEAMDEEKENQKKSKKDKEEDRVFDTKIYESIAFEPDMSKIKEIFNITIKDDSFEEIKKLTNYLVDIVDADQFPMETTPNSPSITYQHNSHNKNNNCINLTTTTATTLNNTNNQKKSVIDKQNQKSNFNCIKHNKIKLSLATEIKNTLAPTLKSKLNLQLNSFFKHRPVLTMPMIEIKSPISHRKLSSTKMNSSKEKKKSNLVINHNYMQSMPSELNSYRSREKRKINSNNTHELFNLSNQSNSKNKYLSTITSYNNSKRKELSIKPTKKMNINEKTKQYLNLYLTNGWLTERKSGKKCFKIIH